MADSKNSQTHAQRRRLEAQDASRRKLRAGQFVRRLKELATKAETCEPDRIPAMRLQADIYMKLLAKCLPDLKAIEHSGTVTHRYEDAVLGLLNGSATQARDTASAEPITH